jgi:hypothetical protein
MLSRSWQGRGGLVQRHLRRPRGLFFYELAVTLHRNIFACIDRIIGREYHSLDATVERPTRQNADAFFAELATITKLTGSITHAFVDDQQHPVGYVQLHRAGGEITIHRIWTVYPKRGFGSRMLRKVCELADRHKVFIRLKIAPLGPKPYPMSAEQLREWYHRHGFVGERKLIRVPAAKRNIHEEHEEHEGTEETEATNGTNTHE